MHIQPAVIAACSIVVAMRALHLPSWLWQSVLAKLSVIIKVDDKALMQVINMLEVTADRESEVIPPSEPEESVALSNEIASYLSSKQASLSPPSSPMEFYDGNETPTDVNDIDF